MLLFHRTCQGSRGKGAEGVTQQVGVEAGKETQNVLAMLHGMWGSSWTVAGSHGRRPQPRLNS